VCILSPSLLLSLSPHPSANNYLIFFFNGSVGLVIL